MRKIFFLLCLLLSTQFTNAKTTDASQKIEITVRGQHSLSDKPARIPAYIPSVYLEDTTLSFEASCIGCTITLLQNHNAVFTAIIDEDGIVVLPDYLFGVYELQLQFGSLTFVGEIEL